MDGRILVDSNCLYSPSCPPKMGALEGMKPSRKPSLAKPVLLQWESSSEPGGPVKLTRVELPRRLFLAIRKVGAARRQGILESVRAAKLRFRGIEVVQPLALFRIRPQRPRRPSGQYLCRESEALWLERQRVGLTPALRARIKVCALDLSAMETWRVPQGEFVVRILQCGLSLAVEDEDRGFFKQLALMQERQRIPMRRDRPRKRLPLEWALLSGWRLDSPTTPGFACFSYPALTQYLRFTAGSYSLATVAKTCQRLRLKRLDPALVLSVRQEGERLVLNG
jgi:hypothetical protein